MWRLGVCSGLGFNYGFWRLGFCTTAGFNRTLFRAVERCFVVIALSSSKFGLRYGGQTFVHIS